MPIRSEALRVLEADPVMARLIAAVGPFKLEPASERSPFESLTRAIAHQQLHANAAESILKRFIALYPHAAFPTPQQVQASDAAALRAVGFSFAKIAALKDLADKSLRGIVPESAQLLTLDDEQIIERLTQVRGIGRWTVEMLLMFQLERLDVLPVDDFGVRNGFRLAYGLSGMPTPRALAQFGERWRPCRSVASWYLWRAVELAREERLPRCGRPPRLTLQKAKAKVTAKASRRSAPKSARKVTKKKRTTRSAGARKATR